MVIDRTSSFVIDLNYELGLYDIMNQNKLSSIQEGFKVMKEFARYLAEYFSIYKNKPDELLYQIKKRKVLVEDDKYYIYRFLARFNRTSRYNLQYNTLENISTLELSNVSSQYINFLINEIVNFNWNRLSYMDDYNHSKR